MARAVGERRAVDRDIAKALTPAQERVLIEALRVHPAPLRQPNARVATALVSAGAFRPAATDAEPSFALTPQGLDVAARLSAQSVIDAVNARRAGGTRQASKPGATPSPANPAPDRLSGKPADWPFPESGHAW